MSTYLMALSDDQCRDILTDLDEHDLKTSVAIIRANIYFRRWGSMPFDERTVCSITKVTPKFYRERLWPVIETRLDVSEDGRRLSNPDIASHRRARPSIQRPEFAAEKSPRHQMAANKRWAHGDVHEGGPAPESPPLTHQDASQEDATTHEDGCNGDAKTPATSTTDACGFASLDATLASDASATPSLSLSEGFLPESLQKAGVAEGERERAPVSAQAGADATVDATDASGDAKPDATMDAKPSASSPAKPRGGRAAQKTTLPYNWTPQADITAEIEEAGRNPVQIAAKFCSHYRSRGEVRADWNEAFRSWWLKEPTFEAPNREMVGVMQALPGGGKPAPVKKPDAAAELAAETAACAGAGYGPSFYRAVRSLKKEVGEVEHRVWFTRLTFDRVEDGAAIVFADTVFHRDHVKTNFGDLLTRALQRQDKAITRIQFETAAEPAETRHRA